MLVQCSSVTFLFDGYCVWHPLTLCATHRFGFAGEYQIKLSAKEIQKENENELNGEKEINK